MSEPPADIGAFVDWLQKMSGAKTREEFAFRAGVRTEQVSKWANGQGLSARNLLKLIRASGVLRDAPMPAERGEDALAQIARLAEAVALQAEIQAAEAESVRDRLDELTRLVSALAPRRSAREA